MNHVQQQFVLHRPADFPSHAVCRIRADDQLAGQPTSVLVMVENEADDIRCVVVIQILLIELTDRWVINNSNTQFGP